MPKIYLLWEKLIIKKSIYTHSLNVEIDAIFNKILIRPCMKCEDITIVLFLISRSKNFKMNQFIAIHRQVQAIALHHLATAQSLRLIGDQT